MAKLVATPIGYDDERRAVGASLHGVHLYMVNYILYNNTNNIYFTQYKTGIKITENKLVYINHRWVETRLRHVSIMFNNQFGIIGK